MRAHVLSDLHLEFGDFEPPRPPCDVVILAGDIHVGARAIAWIERWFADTPVVYVLGNHEYYRENLNRLPDKLRRASEHEALHVLDRGELIVSGARVLAATLWTDYELDGDPARARASAEASMSDFGLIRCGATYRRIRTADLIAEHRQSRRWLEQKLAEPFAGPTIVVTHHAPLRQSIHERYFGDKLNASFASDLEATVALGPQLWVHGHTHASFDYRHAATRVVCNPRGYAGVELNPDFRPDLVVDLVSD